MRFQKVFIFPYIIALNQLCSFIRLEIISKHVEHFSFRITDKAFLLITSKVLELETCFKKQMKEIQKPFETSPHLVFQNRLKNDRVK